MYGFDMKKTVQNIVNEALESGMCDVIKIRLKRRDTTRRKEK